MRYNLSEINALIKDRRTIFPEQFSARKVHKEIIEVLLENARWAPTHKLTQPWYFKVYMGNGLRQFAEFHANTYKQISAENFDEKKYQRMLERPLKCSALMVACMKRDSKRGVPEVEELAAAACAIQNMFLTATAYGLAFYWGSGGLTYTSEMKSFVGINQEDQVLGLIHIGYPAIEWPKRGIRKLKDEYVDWVE